MQLVAFGWIFRYLVFNHLCNQMLNVMEFLCKPSLRILFSFLQLKQVVITGLFSICPFRLVHVVSYEDQVSQGCIMKYHISVGIVG